MRLAAGGRTMRERLNRGQPYHRPQALPRICVRNTRQRERQTVAAAVLIVALLATTLSVSAQPQTGDSGDHVGASGGSASAVMLAPSGTLALPSLPFEGAAPADAREAAPAAQPARAASSDEPPTSGWFRAAAEQYQVSPYLLQALHQVESGASPNSCMANLDGSGATGPFQFKRATFDRYAVDANHDGQADVCAFSDALFSAARYLRAVGADDDVTSAGTRQALLRYGTDADRVVSLALHYQAHAGGLEVGTAIMRSESTVNTAQN
ncbi:MAG: lytic transglycosylase domain-containing protein [Chloroflexi bacterium]|nr:lytic transglycosylase domain-containing protein [Chloroflexota bacterium]